jgi:urease accessory protein UreF
VLAAAGPPASLPSDSTPALDLLADVHLTAEVRLFAS